MPDPTYTIRRLSRSISLETDETLGIPVNCAVSYRVTSSIPVEENDAVTALRSYLTSNDLLVFLEMPLKSLSSTERWLPNEYLVEARYERNLSSSSSSSGGDDDPDTTVNPRPATRKNVQYSTSTATRTVSLARLNSWGNMPSYGGLIDVQPDSDGALKPNGIPVLVPSGTYTKTVFKKNSEFTDSVKHRMLAARCKVNSDSYDGFGAGTLLFTGFSSSRDSSTKWIEIQMNFQISLSESDIQIGSMTVSKSGWSALWVRYAPRISQVDGQFVKTVVPIGVAEEQVYSTVSFASALID